MSAIPDIPGEISCMAATEAALADAPPPVQIEKGAICICGARKRQSKRRDDEPRDVLDQLLESALLESDYVVGAETRYEQLVDLDDWIGDLQGEVASARFFRRTAQESLAAAQHNNARLEGLLQLATSRLKEASRTILNLSTRVPLEHDALEHSTLREVRQRYAGIFDEMETLAHEMWPGDDVLADVSDAHEVAAQAAK